VSGAAWSVGNWTHGLIGSECRKAYRAFHNELRARHITYYNERPDQRSLNPKRPFEARTLADAFPPGYGHLAAASDIEWHPYAKSGGSSQVLLLALLGPAIENDPSLESLWRVPGVLGPVGELKSAQFEFTVSPELLHEQPRRTALDWLVIGDQLVLAAEAKFTEQGLGRCSCPERDNGQCSSAVLSRHYWDVAKEQFGWSGSSTAGTCPLSLAYQAVRNVAAAAALTGPPPQLGAFALFYDERNPYFAGAGEWPGWAGVLEAELGNAPDVQFSAVSWQELLTATSIPDAVRTWAEEKHGLVAHDPSKLPQLCGYDADGDVWVEQCNAVPTEQTALREVARLDHGAETWVVVGVDWMSPFGGGGWKVCEEGRDQARRFWHVQWANGANY
jgi:hypothetical protein